MLLPAEERPRNDKVFAFNLGSLEGIDEYKALHAVAKLLYCIPFELNMHASWLQLQLTEHFEVAYFGHPDNLWHRMHRDGGIQDQDTGVKITILLALCRETGATLKLEDGTTMPLRNNTLILLKSRTVAYEIT